MKSLYSNFSNRKHLWRGFGLLLLWLAGLAPLESGALADRVLNVFDFPTTSAARSAWRAETDSPLVGLFPGDAQSAAKGTRFPCEFVENSPRCYWDRSITADLSGESVFLLHLCVENPTPIAHLTLFFRSGSGWYGGGASGLKRGWQTVRFFKDQFTTEGTPTGWNQIDGIRLSPWKSTEGSSALIANSLQAINPPLTIVRGSKNPETQTASETCDRVAAILDALGLEYKIIADEDVEQGKLTGAELAILPYNNGMSGTELSSLESFSASGGKIIAFYSLDSRVAALLGIQVRGWRQVSLSRMRLAEGLLDCAPESVRQSSWNIMQVSSARADCRVLARWEDASGAMISDPAWLLSDSGAYMSHIILGDDPAGTQQLLGAVLANFMPEIMEGLARTALERLGVFEPFGSYEESFAQIEKEAAAGPRLAEVRARLSEANILRAKALDDSSTNSYCQRISDANAAQSLLLDAWFLAQSPKVPELRAAWNHTGTGVWPGDWNHSAENLAANGFNAIFPNMLWGGLAHYNSALLPHSATYAQYGDQIQACVQACHAHGIEVHVWKVNWNLSTAPADFLTSMRAQGRTQVDVSGNAVDWLCPSNPENLALERDSMVETAAKYDIDGIHFDYIRYPDESSCYCDFCRQRFERDTGLQVSQWPADCYSGSLKPNYRAWRADQITNLVREVSEAARAARPDIQISAAVFPNYPDCVTQIGQDWLKWAESGYLDFVCPMDYSTSSESFRGTVSGQLSKVAGRIPMYPGIGATLGQTADQTVYQIRIVRELGTQGFVLFNYDLSLAEERLPILRKGLTAPLYAPSALWIR